MEGLPSIDITQYVELFIERFGPLGVGATIIAILNWIKLIPPLYRDKSKLKGRMKPYYPLIAIILGIIINLIILWTFGEMTKVYVVSAIGVGVVIGLGAAGVYTLVKKIGTTPPGKKPPS